MNKINNKLSKVAICEKCGGFILVSHINYITKETEKEFTQLTNEGFIVILETIEETQARKMAIYGDCIVNKCKKLKHL